MFVVRRARHELRVRALPLRTRLEARRQARSHDPRVKSRISPQETMLGADLAHYFAVGADARSLICEGLEAAGRPAPTSVLDFPCGHGRVLRFLVAAWPDAEHTACDIDRAGVDFCAAALGAAPAYSTDPLDDVSLGGRFDLVWCGSLLTHFDAPRWAEALRFFSRHLQQDGVVVVTTHGDFTAHLLRSGEHFPGIPDRYGFGSEEAGRLVGRYETEGFAFSRYPGDPPTAAYGHALSSPAWARSQFEAHGFLVRHFAPRRWGSHQDAWTLARA